MNWNKVFTPAWCLGVGLILLLGWLLHVVSWPIRMLGRLVGAHRWSKWI